MLLVSVLFVCLCLLFEATQETLTVSRTAPEMLSPTPADIRTPAAESTITITITITVTVTITIAIIIIAITITISIVNRNSNSTSNINI